jgi:hypothetical protein
MSKKTASASQSESTTASIERITQKEAVKRAIAAGKASPTEGVVYIKATFGMDLNTGAFSTLKTLLKKTGAPAKRGRRPGAKAAATPSGSFAGNGRKTGNAVDLARSVKVLVEQHGAEAVADMAKVFAD